MRVNTLLIASLAGAAFARPVETVPEDSIVTDLVGLNTLPVGRRQSDGDDSAHGLGSTLEPVVRLLNPSSLGGVKKRQLIPNLVEAVNGPDLPKKRQLNDATGELSDLGDLGLKKRQLGDATGELSDLGDLGLKKRQLGDATGELSDLGDLGLKKRQLGDATGELSDLGDLGLKKRQLGDATGELSDLGDLGLKKRQLGDATAELTSPLDTLSNVKRQLSDVTNEVDRLDFIGLVRRQVQSLTDAVNTLTGRQSQASGILGGSALEDLPLIGTAA